MRMRIFNKLRDLVWKNRISDNIGSGGGGVSQMPPIIVRAEPVKDNLKIVDTYLDSFTGRVVRVMSDGTRHQIGI